ncbi:hypothetical protein GALMADRAFT_236542 [Galerina marginata CBS 339.88]|uniref:Uncharacterized protein n=1 Tax=Galerina marginata (strain CBS 339.88) TaxID=685588 RepID=A0A067TLB5_GALM3|nr:hypothetical protein GALMADRAFT_236542 [Galerina marginata CBS 339.88]
MFSIERLFPRLPTGSDRIKRRRSLDGDKRIVNARKPVRKGVESFAFLDMYVCAHCGQRRSA